MPSLRDRNRQIPGGLLYYCPQIPAWRPQPWSSLDSLADQVIAVRQANPALTQKHGWSLDKNAVLNELDHFNANICVAQGWDNYVIGSEGAPLPKVRPPSNQEIQQLSAVAAKTRLIWAGVKTLGSWLASGEPGVSSELAEHRASVCVACPKNDQGGFDSWFTKPAAAAIEKQLERRQEMGLSTTQDAKLQVCSACLCPLKLKVHTPMKFIKPQLKDETIDKLREAPSCWLIAELNA